ncbi:aspartate aminotransferase family protein [Pseudomonas sp. JS3066]|jgi:adenosylmethionine-8-amino-7-oxononanoate aminotransferase|uniref:aspartate aminotransferase family protein n=1 Tax=unclassified Pseudomonas TaxID=196821 RepID=UPI000EAA06FD|nr:MULTISPECIES: aspartate aminotransferase family protein [unclassified Pseudomonas]AYF87829.1 aspartate aminotransferase family protein [Pseudomonas sp. DY-1]MDH4655612.1 aspartate aminotransferase family protein [Pseudomonas sp. BN606]MRK19886.1 aspartate aminotransferase family protein [Pseudomonas sp. JG-B]WVK94605.1 aspartate aminotransferase family protein [Pseudomonas sp. JS3066]
MTTRDNAFWHPMLHPNEMKQREPIRILRGEGCFVFDDKGNRLVDGVAGLWNVNVGHGRKEIKAAIAAQLDELEYFQLFDGISHPRAEELAAKVIGMLEPEGMRRVAFSSGGSDAVETALKLARQYWKLQGQADRTKFISLRQGYHGTHFGGASVNGNTVFRRNYEPLLPGCFHVDTPWLYRNPYSQDPAELAQICADLLEREIQFQSPDTVAAFIAEPIQGAGGVIVPPENYWPLIRKVCDKYGVLLIADEIVTGFGRSGSMFGSRLWGVKPDIMCLAKGISSGYIPLGATVVNERIEQAFANNGNFTGAIMHGYTYSGHPVACAAGLANLDIVEKENLPANATKQGDYLLKSLATFPERFAAVGEVRGKGLMVALDLVSDKTTREPIDPMGGYANRVAEIARANGVMVRPVGTKIILSPPLVIEQEQIDTIVNALAIGFQEAHR